MEVLIFLCMTNSEVATYFILKVYLITSFLMFLTRCFQQAAAAVKVFNFGCEGVKQAEIKKSTFSSVVIRSLISNERKGTTECTL